MAFLVNVPRVAGVPAVAFAPGAGGPPLVALVSDLIVEIAAPGAVWGFFISGSPVIVADNVVAFDFRQEFTLSDYPVERGGFETFDKVALPYDVRFRVSAGSAQARQEMIASINAVIGTTQLVDAVTPDAVYSSVNLTHQDYHRTAQNGLGLLQIDVWGLRVNQSATMSSSGGAPTTTSTPGGIGSDYVASQPSGADQQSGGAVQSADPTTVQTGSVSSSTQLTPEGLEAAGGVP